MIGAETRFALPIRQTYSLLGVGITVFSRAAKPFESFRDVGLHAATGLEKHTKIVFRNGVTAIRGPAQPLRAFGQVLRRTFPLQDHQAKPRLGLGDALFGRL